MRFPDVGDAAVGRFCDKAEFLNVSLLVGSHLDDGNLVLGLQAQQGQRHADMVVQIPNSGKRIEFLLQHTMQEFLGSSFSIGAC